ncbi:MAG: PGPGW domain-containing protein [Patescibacteria group bacterium]
MIIWKEWFKKVFYKNSPANKIVGALLIIVGIAALVTPLSPGSWLIFIGLGLLGVRLVFWERFKVMLKDKYTTWKNK